MARLARAEVFAADEVAIVHVMNRTVRRCFLLGDDPLTGKNYDHRKQWIDDQLIHQARFFGIDLLCQAIMSNHFHLVLRSRPDVVAEWDDSEVVRRWLMLCPFRRDEDRRPAEPTAAEIRSICKDKDKLQQLRSRLSDISWWMRLLSQNIAQRANRDDEEVGKFWQARYRAVRLLDETAVLACAAYVDLNPIRAAMAESIEASDYTSGQKRCHDLQAARARAKAAQTEGSAAHSRRARHLAPVDLKERSALTGPQVHQGRSRCSNKGFLPMTTAEYLQLLDWTARQNRPGKAGSTPEHIPPLLERLGVNADIWHRLVSDFGRLFSLMAGQPRRIVEHQPRRRGSGHRYRVRQEARELFSSA